MCHFFRFMSQTSLLVIPFEKKRMCKSFILNKETPTGFCHWDKNPKPRHSPLSNREPFKSSDNEQDRKGERVEREKGRHKKREREIERCKMERITNECAAEREP